MMKQNDLPGNVRAHGLALLMAVLIVVSISLMPSSSAVALAQSVPNACKDDAGKVLIPSAGGGVGAWLLVLNFNHAPSATSTTGCLVTTIALNPQRVSRTFVTCQLVDNVNLASVGNGVAPFDGQFSISCPGISPGKKKLENFTIWGRANFTNPNTAYAILNHPDVSFSAGLSPSWRVSFDSRYGANSFSSGDAATNLNGQVVSFTSAVRSLTGSHSLNGTQLAPLATVSPFDFRFDQPIVIGAAGQVWTLAEIIVDPPGGCCKS